ncbi:TonB-dependent receptor [Bacteroides sp. An269]|uniref:SusC/RagA family TonB-linked outer membrane protein n=1 Tax=unclassified Bacteroides TaxID=2646097 RepID=UPI000B39395C|nr:TonB-dependent receptor [Bacteroides sp. An269]OUO59349.1 SusC/RagA family protein [Bacteroides sp. An279]OUO72432.1 SusC/RagA family protein [Bacteroides sp. An269]
MASKMKSMRYVLLFFAAMISLSVSAQNVTVKGTVKDNTGETVIGASVVEKGNTTNGAITDLDGNFTLTVPSDATLVFSYIGMKTQEVAVKGRTILNITMDDDSQALEEVVVIGYGSVRRKDLTGSVATVDADVLTAVPVASATEALTGKMAGVQITTTEGSPDAEMKIRVRGGGSITGDNSPLFIVDGFPVESISDIPASEIEDITVLKDASSTAIYGSRGANGVILVTTKSGKEGKVSVSYNAYYSWKKIANTMDVLDPYDYAKWQYELALLKDDLTSYEQYFGKYEDMDMYQNIPYNDWQDLTFGRIGHTFNHNLNISGGTERIRYSFSYAHMNDKAIMEGSNYKRDNFSLKLNTKPTKNTTLDFSIRYSETDIRGGGANETSSTLDTDKRLKYSVIYTPIPLANLDESAGSADDDLGNLYHPITAIWDNDRMKERKTLNMNGSFGWEIFKNFKVKTEFGYDDYRNNDQRFWGTTTYYIKNTPAAANQGHPAIRINNLFRHRFRNTNTINYDFEKVLKNKDHSLNLLVGHEWIITKENELENEVHGFPDWISATEAWKLTNIQGTTPYNIENTLNPDDKLFSFFGRVNYNYKSKYLLTATFRADASSKFSEDNRWGFFPSAAVAWRISSESFMEGAKNWLDDLKLRFSYGTAGNNNIPSGQLVQVYNSNTTSWINGFNNYWAPSKTMANPDLKWETTITRNLGLDFTLFGGKLNGTIEAYLNTTKDLLINFPVSGTGYDTQYRNMGETQNKGIEATINWTIVNKKNWGISLNANIGFNKNEIKDLGIMQDFGQDTSWASSEIGQDFWIAKGGSVGEMLGYRSAGRYEVSDFVGYDAASETWILKEGVDDCTAVVGTLRPGMMKLKDLSGDGVVTGGYEDREIIGDANPVATGGFGINARAYGFDLSANFNFSIGNDVYNANKIEYTMTGKYQYRNMTTEMADGNRWTNLNPDGTICNDPEQLAAMNANTTMWSPMTQRMVFSDWAVEDGSFLRLNTLTLGYTLPESLMNKVHIKNLRFYVTAYNVFCLTGYSGFDPEVSTALQTNLTPGVDYSAYPKSRQFVIGVNLNF